MYAVSSRSFARAMRRQWREFTRPRLSLRLCLFEEGYSLDLFGLFIPLTFLDHWAYEPHEIMESWGATWCERSVHLNWGRHCKIIHLPWEFDHVNSSHQVLRPDGSWVPFVGCWETGPARGNGFGGKEPDGRWEESYPYRYVLRSGEVQERTATISVERREWRWRWLMWCPLFAKRRQSIDIAFDGEVGERSGSWKGGVIGTGYEMRKGESPLDTLRRMERDWKA